MRWEDDDEAIKHFIMNLIPVEMFNRIKTGMNAKHWWDELKTITTMQEQNISTYIITLCSNTQRQN
jgi:hypothetical protein